MRTRLLLTGLLTVAALTGCKRQTFDEAVSREVARFNHDDAPKREEPILVCDSMSYDAATRTLGYYYTVEGMGEELFPAEEMRADILRKINGSLPLKRHKEHGVTFRYCYHGKASGDVLLDAVFTPEDYR